MFTVKFQGEKREVVLRSSWECSSHNTEYVHCLLNFHLVDNRCNNDQCGDLLFTIRLQTSLASDSDEKLTTLSPDKNKAYVEWYAARVILPSLYIENFLEHSELCNKVLLKLSATIEKFNINHRHTDLLMVYFDAITLNMFRYCRFNSRNTYPNEWEFYDYVSINQIGER